MPGGGFKAPLSRIAKRKKELDSKKTEKKLQLDKSVDFRELPVLNKQKTHSILSLDRCSSTPNEPCNLKQKKPLMFGSTDNISMISKVDNCSGISFNTSSVGSLRDPLERAHITEYGRIRSISSLFLRRKVERQFKEETDLLKGLLLKKWVEIQDLRMEIRRSLNEINLLKMDHFLKNIMEHHRNNVKKLFDIISELENPVDDLAKSLSLSDGCLTNTPASLSEIRNFQSLLEKAEKDTENTVQDLSNFNKKLDSQNLRNLLVECGGLLTEEFSKIEALNDIATAKSGRLVNRYVAELCKRDEFVAQR